MNPNKCSLTISKLAYLQQRFAEEGLGGQFNLAAVSYDPAFDLPRRLHIYGAARGMVFDERNRLMRTTGSFEPFRRRFNLGVGYSSTTVNHHRLELIVLDDAMRLRADYTRIQWRESDVFSALKALLAQNPVRR